MEEQPKIAKKAKEQPLQVEERTCRILAKAILERIINKEK